MKSEAVIDNRDPIEVIMTRLRARGSTDQTIERFRQYTVKFLNFINKKNKKLKNVTCDDLIEYFSKLTCCGNTKSTMFYAYRTIFKIWGIEWTLEKYDAPKKSSPHRPYFTDDEIKRIIETADKISIQAGTLVRIARDCGCRRRAINKMNTSDFIDGDPPQLLVPPVKRGRSVEMIISKETACFIKKMIQLRDDRNNALFINKRKERMSLADLSNLFCDIREYAGIKKNKAGIHAMRRSKVTRLRKHGVDEFDIVETMGWRAGSAMVHTYAQLDKSEIQKKSANADPMMRENQ